MKVFIAVVCDRHAMPEVRVFTDEDKAIAWADANFRACLAHPDEMILGDEDGCPVEGTLWYASYSMESDHAWVEWGTLDDDSEIGS